MIRACWYLEAKPATANDQDGEVIIIWLFRLVSFVLMLLSFKSFCCWFEFGAQQTGELQQAVIGH